MTARSPSPDQGDVIRTDAMGSDLTPVNAARASFNQRSKALEADDEQPA